MAVPLQTTDAGDARVGAARLEFLRDLVGVRPGERPPLGYCNAAARRAPDGRFRYEALALVHSETSGFHPVMHLIIVCP